MLTRHMEKAPYVGHQHALVAKLRKRPAERPTCTAKTGFGRSYGGQWHTGRVPPRSVAMTILLGLREILVDLVQVGDT